MTITLIEYELVEYEFPKLFVDFVNSFNLLDSNLELCIGWFITGGQPRLAYPLITKLSTHEKINYLKNVINDKLFENQKKLVEDFNKWFSIASKAKCRRNNYVHGRWRISPCGETDKYIIYEYQSHNRGKTETFSLDGFRSIVMEMDKIGEDFHVLRKKYLEKYELGRSLPK